MDNENNNDRLLQLVRHVLKQERVLVAKPLQGGALHHMWYLKTDVAEYAVKVINPHIAAKSSFFENYEYSEKLAKCFAQSGIPAIAAMSFNGRYIQTLEEQSYLIYPYINAKPLTPEQLDNQQIVLIGKIFSQMHQLNIQPKKDQSVEYEVFDDCHWEALVNRSGKASLKKLLPTILQWNKKYQAAIPELNKNLLITHRDMHYLNLLWDEKGKPYIIDWESAGLMNPWLEVIGYAMEWSGVIVGAYDLNKTVLLLKSYQEAREIQFTSKIIENAFYGWIGHCLLGWTEFNLRRLLGETGEDKTELARGEEIIDNTMIPCLKFLEAQETSLLEKLYAKTLSVK